MQLCIILLLQFVLGDFQSTLVEVLDAAPDSSTVVQTEIVERIQDEQLEAIFQITENEQPEAYFHITDSNKYLDIDVGSWGANSKEECLNNHQTMCSLLEEEVDENACSETEHMGYAFIKPSGCFHFFSFRYEQTRTQAFHDLINRESKFWLVDVENLADIEPTGNPSEPQPKDAEEFPQDFNAPWNTAKMHDPEAVIGEDNVGYYYPRSGKLGKDVIVYVLDTGFDKTWREDKYEFGDRVFNQFSTVNKKYNKDKNGNEFTFEGDDNGHGSHCIGTVASTTYGMAMGVKIYPIQVLGGNGSGDMAGIIRALEHVSETCLDDQICVVSMSLGIRRVVPVFNEAVTNLVNSGINTVVAAGNSRKDAKYSSPSSALGAITVGSVGKDLSRSSFSNFGSHVDVWAPGEDVTSMWTGGKIYTTQGTSMACPAVAALVAMMQAQEGQRMTRAEVIEKFENGWALKDVVQDTKGGKNLFAIRPLDAYNGRVQFALLTHGHCAENLPFGPCMDGDMAARHIVDISLNKEAKVCSDLYIAQHMHNTWVQEVWDSGSVAMVIRWNFPDITSLRDRFKNAIEHCVPVGYEIDLPNGEEHYRTSEWCFSDSGFVTSPWGQEGQQFGANDGFWGGSDNQIIKGGNSMDMEMGVFGFGNHGGSDVEACDGYWINGQKYESEDLRIKMFMETRQAKSCTWEHATNTKWEMVCSDGYVCNALEEGWGCCANHGDRATCPKNYPIMCARPNSCGGGTTRCCGTRPHACHPHGGVLPCNIPQHDYDCNYKGCVWDRSQENVEWGFYAKTGGDCESCRQRCSEDPNCGAVECGPQMDYCAWWRTDMCSDPDEANASWYTCRKKESTLPEHVSEDGNRRQLRDRLLREAF